MRCRGRRCVRSSADEKRSGGESYAKLRFDGFSRHNRSTSRSIAAASSAVTVTFVTKSPATANLRRFSASCGVISPACAFASIRRLALSSSSQSRPGFRDNGDSPVMSVQIPQDTLLDAEAVMDVVADMYAAKHDQSRVRPQHG